MPWVDIFRFDIFLNNLRKISCNIQLKNSLTRIFRSKVTFPRIPNLLVSDLYRRGHFWMALTIQFRQEVHLKFKFLQCDYYLFIPSKVLLLYLNGQRETKIVGFLIVYRVYFGVAKAILIRFIVNGVRKCMSWCVIKTRHTRIHN